jgi:uncharacterized protein (DUF58 family)
MRRHRKRWGVGLLGALVLVGLGLLYADATLLAAALIPLLYVLYGTLSTVPADSKVTVERSIRPSTPEPGEPIQVRLQIRNGGESVLSDVRVIDGVPEELVVTAGSPRLAAPLSPGETVSTTYTAIAKRGEFAFGDPAVRVRALAGSQRETKAVPAVGDTRFTCANVSGDPPVVDRSIQRQGSLSVDEGGPGLEFYSTRQYMRGDPVNRIDWHHVAKTGEFITVQYRKEQAVRAVVIVDARSLNSVTPAAGYPTGTQLCAYAGERLFESLEDAGVVTSATALGFEAGELGGLVGPDGLPWIDPEHDSGKRGRASLLFHRLQTETDRPASPLSLALPRQVYSSGTWTDGAPDSPGGQPTATQPSQGARADGGPPSWQDRQADPDERLHRVLSRLPADAQVVLCSPLLDTWPVELASALSMREYPLVVLSPDVLSAGTDGQRLAAVGRRARLRALEYMGAETVDWQISDSIDYAVRHSLPTLLSDQ